jgi:catalase
MKETLTTNQAAPVSDDQNSLTVGGNGHVMLQDVHLIETLTHFNREQIHERVACTKGVVLI